MEKPARNIPLAKPNLLSNELRTKKKTSESPKGTHLPVSTDSGGFIESLSTTMPASSGDPMAKLKSKRRLNNTIGGPVISSGLAGKRDPRSRHSTGRLSNSLGAKNIGSLFGDDDESKESGVVQTPQLDAPDDGVSTIKVPLKCKLITTILLDTSHFSRDPVSSVSRSFSFLASALYMFKQ